MPLVECARCGRQSEGLSVPPLPGEVGRAVLAATCGSCWRDWLGEQVKLINEEALTPANPEHYARLVERMASYLGLRRQAGPGGP